MLVTCVPTMEYALSYKIRSPAHALKVLLHRDVKWKLISVDHLRVFMESAKNKPTRSVVTASSDFMAVIVENARYFHPEYHYWTPS